MKTIKVIIRVGKKQHTIYGIRHVEPMAKQSGLCFYFAEKLNGYNCQFAMNAKIIEVSICDLGNEFIEAETTKALGW